MPARRLLYLTGRKLAAFDSSHGTLSAEGVFESGDEGVADFTRYVAEAPHALYYVLADVVEEDFFQETIPYVRGGDRATLLGRKLAQRYRDTSLAMALPIGTENIAGRREERILYSSFTNTQQFQPWLAAIRQHETRLVGVYSIALLSPLVGKRIGIAAKRYVLVSLQEGGLRQTYVEDGNIRFSRLGRADPSDPHAVAEACAAESERIHQYLINLRMLARDAPPLDIVILAPAEHQPYYESVCISSARLKFQVRNLESTCTGVGLKKSPAGMMAERLFLHVLSGGQPPHQFASNSLLRFYHLWRARVAMIAAGAAVGGFCALLAGLKLADVYGVQQQAETERQQQVQATLQYERLQATFPKTPLAREDLKAVVDAFRVIQSQTALPEQLWVQISQAMASTPQIEIDRLEWEVSGTPLGRFGRDAAKAAPAAARAAPVAPGAPGAPASPAQQYQVAEVAARIQAVNVSDYRAINLLVGEFVEALRARPGIAVTTTRMPFDLDTERSLSGDIGAERKTEVPRFSVVISRKFGS